MYDITTHGDFRKYYDTTQKRTYWVLGYFGGGSINIMEAFNVAKLYSDELGVSIESVKIDEVLHSRRYKGFKFIYSTDQSEKTKDSESFENVFQMLCA